MALTKAETARVALRQAQRQLDELNLGESGSRHRNIAEGLKQATAYIEAQEARVGRLLETATLRDGIAIQRGLDEAGVMGAIRQMSPTEGDAPATYRVEMGGGAIEGTVDQLTAILALFPRARQQEG